MPSETKIKLGCLNEQQYEIVTDSYDKHTVVIAGAGSGKTRTLITRMMYLIEVMNVNPSQIVAITFTRKAAMEMKNRLEKELGYLDKVTIGTFHSVCGQYIKRFGESIGLSKNYKQLTEYDTKGVIMDILKNRNVLIDKNQVNDIASFISVQKSNCCSPKKFLEHASIIENNVSEEDKFFGHIYEAYMQECANKNYLDYDDLILKAILLFGNPYMKEWAGNNIKYLLVDEYQDINFAQYVLIKRMINNDCNLFAVGDVKQCLLPKTNIKTKDGYKRIDEIKTSDIITVASGHSKILNCNPNEILKKQYNGTIIKMTTESGKVLEGTPNHMIFANLPIEKDVYYIYLMHKDDFGFRVGMTTSCYNHNIKKDENGIMHRLAMENAGKIWIIDRAENMKHAIYLENYYAYKYSCPQYVFKPRDKNGLDIEYIKKLSNDLNTFDNGIRLLKDKDLSFDDPHHIPQASNSKNITRNKLNFVMFGSNAVNKENNNHKHELSASTINKEYSNVMEKYISINAKKNGNGYEYFNGRKINSSYDELYNIAMQIKNDMNKCSSNFNISAKAKLTDKKFNFTPLSNILIGSTVPVLNDGAIIEDKVISIEKYSYTGDVYDINVNNYRNYIANDIVVHNCIYEFRSSDPEFLENFGDMFEDSKIMYLNQNYRSTQNIVNASNSLIRNNESKYNMECFTENKEGEPVFINECYDEYDEACFVIEKIKEKVDNGASYSDIAILYRINSQSAVLEEMLIENNIPYFVYKGISFFKRAEVLDILSFLKFIEDYTNKDAFIRSMGTLEGVGKKTITTIAEYSDYNNMNYYTGLIMYLEENSDKKGKILDKLKYVLEVYNDISSYQYNKLGDLISYVVKRTGYVDILNKKMDRKTQEDREKILTRKRNVEELENMANHMCRSIQEGAIKHFLEQTEVVVDEEECMEQVKLITIHSAKGLEYPCVFIVGVEDNLIPHYLSVTPKKIQEERRLLYVAMTRAKEELYMTYCCERTVFDRQKSVNISPFINEIDSEFTKVINNNNNNYNDYNTDNVYNTNINNNTDNENNINNTDYNYNFDINFDYNN